MYIFQTIFYVTKVKLYKISYPDHVYIFYIENSTDCVIMGPDTCHAYTRYFRSLALNETCIYKNNIKRIYSKARE